MIHPSAGTVWMTQHQIADLFGVFVSAVGSNIRSILKNEVLREENVCRERTHKDGSIITIYNLEMITALAFRLKSRQAGTVSTLDGRTGGKSDYSLENTRRKRDAELSAAPLRLLLPEIFEDLRRANAGGLLPGEREIMATIRI